jgi:hypothetical protein
LRKKTFFVSESTTNLLMFQSRLLTGSCTSSSSSSTSTSHSSTTAATSCYRLPQPTGREYKSAVAHFFHQQQQQSINPPQSADDQLPPRPPRRSSSSGSPSLVASPEPVRRPAEAVGPHEVSRRLQGLAAARQLGCGEGWEHPRPPWAVAERLSVQASDSKRPLVHHVVIKRSQDSHSVSPSEAKRASVQERQPASGPLRSAQQNGQPRSSENQRTEMQLFIQGKCSFKNTCCGSLC